MRVPAALTAARQPFKSHTWAAALSVVLDRDGDLDRTRRLGLTRFQTAVSRVLVTGAGRNRADGSPATYTRP
jgi:transposase